MLNWLKQAGRTELEARLVSTMSTGSSGATQKTLLQEQKTKNVSCFVIWAFCSVKFLWIILPFVIFDST